MFALFMFIHAHTHTLTQATYKSTEPISNWAQVAGANSTVIHKVRTVQAFSIIGGVVKIMGTLSFVSGRFAARTASQALQVGWTCVCGFVCVCVWYMWQ